MVVVFCLWVATALINSAWDMIDTCYIQGQGQIRHKNPTSPIGLFSVGVPSDLLGSEAPSPIN